MGSKNNPGGIHHRKVVNKVVPHYENKKNPSRCFIRLYELYVSKCPPNPLGRSFFLHSLNHPTSERWYSNQVVGYNLLSTTVKRLFCCWNRREKNIPIHLHGILQTSRNSHLLTHCMHVLHVCMYSILYCFEKN